MRSAARWILLVAIASLFAFTGSAQGIVVFTVGTTADTVDATPGDGICADAGGHCSLRAAIQEADSDSGQIGIDVPAGTYTATLANPNGPSGVIPPRGFDPATGDLDLAGNVGIFGAGAGRTIVSGGSLDRVFEVRPSANVVLQGLTIEHGAVWDCDGGLGVYNAGALDLEADDVTGNTGSCGNAGGVYNAGQLTANGTTIADNSEFGGGGLYNTGTAVLSASTLSGNHGDFGGGGGIDNHGSLALTNVTLSGNAANSANGGALLASAGTAVLRSVTIVSNGAGGTGHGGGIRFAGGSVTLQDTLLAANGTNCAGGAPASAGNNLEDRTDCALAGSHDLSSADPRVAALADNGGPVQTAALTAGSPAVDAGANCPAVDARGVVRPQGAACDIGAFELAPTVSASSSTVVANPGSVVADGSAAATVTVTLKDTLGGAVAGKTVMLSPGAQSATTNAGGVATFAVTDTTAETVTYSARDATDSVTVAQTASVTFTAPPAPAPPPATTTVAAPVAPPPPVTTTAAPPPVAPDQPVAAPAEESVPESVPGPPVVVLAPPVDLLALVAAPVARAAVPPAPVVTLTKSGLLVRLDARLSRDPDDRIASYAWQFGDHVAGKGESVSHRYTRAGDYTVTLSETDLHGATATVTRRVAVQPAKASVQVTEAIGLTGAPAAGSVLVDEHVSAGGGPTVKNPPIRKKG